MGARGWENGDTFSWEDGKVLETAGGDGYSYVNLLIATELCALNGQNSHLYVLAVLPQLKQKEWGP